MTFPVLVYYNLTVKHEYCKWPFDFSFVKEWWNDGWWPLFVLSKNAREPKNGHSVVFTLQLDFSVFFTRTSIFSCLIFYPLFWIVGQILIICFIKIDRFGVSILIDTREVTNKMDFLVKNTLKSNCNVKKISNTDFPVFGHFFKERSMPLVLIWAVFPEKFSANMKSGQCFHNTFLCFSMVSITCWISSTDWLVGNTDDKICNDQRIFHRVKSICNHKNAIKFHFTSCESSPLVDFKAFKSFQSKLRLFNHEFSWTGRTNFI